MFHAFNAAEGDSCLFQVVSKPAFLDQITQLLLKFKNILLCWAIPWRVGIEAGATGLIEHPDGRLAVAEGDFSTDQGPG